jgi:gliding motility-associated-like protein
MSKSLIVNILASISRFTSHYFIYFSLSACSQTVNVGTNSYANENRQNEPQKFTTSNEACIIKINASFSPNNDGVNDQLIWQVSGEVEDFSFEIFDRFGIKVFTSNKINEGWNGSNQPSGRYIWVANFKCTRNGQISSEKLKGSVELVKE